MCTVQYAGIHNSARLYVGTLKHVFYTDISKGLNKNFTCQLLFVFELRQTQTSNRKKSKPCMKKFDIFSLKVENWNWKKKSITSNWENIYKYNEVKNFVSRLTIWFCIWLDVRAMNLNMWSLYFYFFLSG